MTPDNKSTSWQIVHNELVDFSDKLKPGLYKATIYTIYNGGYSRCQEQSVQICYALFISKPVVFGDFQPYV